MEDSYRHKGLRNKLVEEIKSKGITDERVLAAIGKVPRHIFMESGFVNFSYKDSAFPIGAGQTISQPYTVAFQTQLLQIKPMEKSVTLTASARRSTPSLRRLRASILNFISFDIAVIF